MSAGKPMTESRLYDLAMRVPIVGVNAAFAWREALGLRQYVTAHPYFEGDGPFLAGLLARIGVAVFLCLLVIFHASRRRPLRKYGEWRPKIDALLGMALIYPVLLLPRAAPDYALDLASSLLLFAGSYLCMVAVASLGRSLSVMPEARRLVTEGLYARIRHPLYLAELIALAGTFLQFRSLAAAALIAAVIYFQFRRMDWEESILLGAFPEYADYRSRSWRLVPGLY